MDSIKQYVKTREKQDWLIFGMIGTAVILGVIFCVLDGKKSHKAPMLQDKLEMASSTQHADVKKHLSGQLHRKIQAQAEIFQKQKEDLDRKNLAVKDAFSKLKEDNKNIHEELVNLKTQLQDAKDNTVDVVQNNYTIAQDMPHGTEHNNHNVLPPAHEMGKTKHMDYLYAAPQQQDYSQNALYNIPPNDELEIISVDLEGGSLGHNIKQSAKNYVAAGTHIKGVLLGGIDAHTEVYGNNETRVVTIRLIEDGIMPNGFKASMKNCVLLASAWGNASSERVVMRGERLSCINSQGNVFEKDIVGIIYGADGREDVRGRVVYPEGKLVQRAFVAGALSGIGSGISDSFVTKSISPLGSTSTVNPGEIFGYGAAQGANKSLDKLADYYIKRAEKLQPIVQVPAGVKVDVVIQKGFSIDEADYTVSTNKSTFKNPNTTKQNNGVTNESISTAHKQALDVLGSFSGDVR